MPFEPSTSRRWSKPYTASRVPLMWHCLPDAVRSTPDLWTLVREYHKYLLGLAGGLIADFVGLIGAILIAYAFYH